MLREKQLDGTIYNKIDIAIENNGADLYGGYTVMVSGGKDSTVITDLAVKSGVKCKFEVSWTGVEYPETVYFLRQEKARLEALGYQFTFIIPRDSAGKQITMWKLIEKKGYPTRKVRHCCAELKEVAGKNSFCVLGVRWAESIRRKNSRFLYEQSGRQIMTNNDNEASRRITENCMKKRKYMLNVIIEWTDDEVWEYIRENNLPYNPLYDMGHKRIGCIGCPLQGSKKQVFELESNPKWKNLYLRAAQWYLDKNATKREGVKKDVESYYRWWTGSKRNKK